MRFRQRVKQEPAREAEERERPHRKLVNYTNAVRAHLGVACWREYSRFARAALLRVDKR